MNIKKPVRLTERNEIVDRNGDILFPDVTRFRCNTSGMQNAAIDHVSRQREIASMVIEMINQDEQRDQFMPKERHKVFGGNHAHKG